MAESVIKRHFTSMERTQLLNGRGSGTYQVDTTGYDFFEYIMLLGNASAPRVISGLTKEKIVRVSFGNNTYITFTLSDSQIVVNAVEGGYTGLLGFVWGYKFAS